MLLTMPAGEGDRDGVGLPEGIREDL